MHKVQTKSHTKETTMPPKAKKMMGKDASDTAPEKELKAPRYAKRPITAAENDVDDFSTDL
jgi:hypothetical protein